MSSTNSPSDEAYRQQQSQPGWDKTTRNKSSTVWMTRGAKFVTLLGAFIAAAVGLQNILDKLPGKADTQIESDTLLRIVRVAENQYELHLNISMVNYGAKSDMILRPKAAFKSDKPVVDCAGYAVFADQEGKDPFPLVLPKDSKEHLTCIIKWNPNDGYEGLASEKGKANAETEAAPIGQVELKWQEKYRQRIERLFILLAWETIKMMKPGESKIINCLDLGDQPIAQGKEAHTAVPSLSLAGWQYENGGVVQLAAMGASSPPAQEAKSHYAVQGEVASGKEVPSPIPGEMIVNIRPCGGAADLVVFKQPFKKRLMGSLPCGVSVVQIEKL